MFERFTDRSRRVIVLAQEESRLLGHSYIGSEHLLLGLIHEGEGLAATVLSEFDVHVHNTRLRLVEIQPLQEMRMGGHLPFTPRCKKIIELALREALALGSNYIGTEHLLLSIIREGEGLGARLLSELGVDPTKLRERIIVRITGSLSIAAQNNPSDAISGDTLALSKSIVSLMSISQDAVVLFIDGRLVNLSPTLEAGLRAAYKKAGDAPIEVTHLRD